MEAFERKVAAKSSKWAKLVSDKPSRVVDTLNDGPSRGDNAEDFLFAMDAIRGVAESFSKETGAKKREWEGLVNAGVAEALCRNVCELQATAPEGSSQRTEAMSSFYAPFVMLYFAAMGFSDPLSEVDQRVLSAVRDSWPQMMTRWWNDPQNTLRQDDTHEPERLVVARLLGHLLIQDSTVYSMIFDPKDHTLSVISRHWAHSISPNVARSTIILLRSIVFFSFSQNVEEYLKNHDRPTLPFLLSKIYSGLEPERPTPEALIAVMSGKLALGDQGYAVEDLTFCHDLYMGFRELEDPSFAEALRKSEAYWRNAFGIMRLNGSTHEQVSVHLMNLAVKMVIQKPTDECAVMTRTWIEAGLFDTLDAAMPDLVRITGLSRVMVFLFTSIKEAAHDFPPDVLELLKAQLPRQKSVAAVIKCDMEKQELTNGKPFGEGLEGDEVPSGEDPMWNNGLWQTLGWLHGLCLDRGMCARRTCGNKGVSQCSSCKKFMYCGPECQKLDWKEHKLLCKWADPYMLAVESGKNRITRSKAAEMGLIDKDAGAEPAVLSLTERWMKMSDWLPPALFIVFVIAAQAFGIFDDLGRWVNGLTSST